MNEYIKDANKLAHLQQVQETQPADSGQQLIPEATIGQLIPRITIGADALMMAAFGLWIIWDRVLRSKFASKLDGVFQPIEEERRLNNILAQIGVITNASRVVLCAFHNGALDNAGYHLTKLSTVNSYTAPGKLPMTVPIRDLPVGRIMYEMEELLNTKDEFGWVMTEYSDDLPDPCKYHLKTNNINTMWNRLIRIGNLPIGILSLQYDETERRKPPIKSEPHAVLLEQLYQEICQVMRRRIIHPSPAKRIWMALTKRMGNTP